MKFRSISVILTILLLVTAMPAAAELPWEFDEHTRFMALGDSLTAGYGAIPVTNGYAYRLYRSGVFDTLPNTIFANAAVPGLTSGQVDTNQVPLAATFQPHFVTMTVGGNDLLSILPDPSQAVVVIGQFAGNLGSILSGLCSSVPDVNIYVGNLYTVPLPGIPVDDVVTAFNGAVELVVGNVNTASSIMGWGCNVKVADVYSAFKDQKGLLLIERKQAGQFEVHPTNAGYRVMTDAFLDVIE
jgi:lysophospholipase L1-like esterase